jgi:hypothetical protein
MQGIKDLDFSKHEEDDYEDEAREWLVSALAEFCENGVPQLLNFKCSLLSIYNLLKEVHANNAAAIKYIKVHKYQVKIGKVQYLRNLEGIGAKDVIGMSYDQFLAARSHAGNPGVPEAKRPRPNELEAGEFRPR